MSSEPTYDASELSDSEQETNHILKKVAVSGDKAEAWKAWIPFAVMWAISAALVFMTVGVLTTQHENSENPPVAQPKVVTPLVWLPLGDSITFGCGSTNQPGTDVIVIMDPNFTCPSICGGYRTPTAQALASRGQIVSTMGTMESGPAQYPQWIKHEGHPGWRIDMADAILPQSLASSPVPPDIITIHLGTNDCWQAPGGNYTAWNTAPNAPEDLVNRMNHLLANINSSVPTASVFLSSIINDPGIGKPSVANCTATFNANLPGIVRTFQAQGMKIAYVPMMENTLICGTSGAREGATKCCSDQTHPVQAGYNDMAKVWATSLTKGGF